MTMISSRIPVVAAVFGLFLTASLAASMHPQDSAADEKNPANAKETAVSEENAPTKYNRLNAFETWVILRKGTERAFTGEFTDKKDPGTYICRRCNAPLYNSEDKFESHCGWPSFDDEIKDAVRKTRDADGFRVEITCMNCGGHLGHVFYGEGFTERNTRHCVNSGSMQFVAKGKKLPPVIKKRTSKRTANSADKESKESSAESEQAKAPADE